MASQIIGDGNVVPPLNITAPAPLIDLRGFRWTTVDEEVNGAQVDQEAEEKSSSRDISEHHERQSQQPLIHAAASSFQRPPFFPGSGGPPGFPGPPRPPGEADTDAPTLQEDATTTQLTEQLGLVHGLPPPALPLFPLTQFQGAYAGNGFNTIFRPRPKVDSTRFPITPNTGGFPDDNTLELNLTTEQLTFGETIGEIPNRGLSLNDQPDITLGGFPYLQTIQDVTNTDTGKGDRPNPKGIHFEPGMWLNVPDSGSPANKASISRMACIPHGTTINAQGLAPTKVQTTTRGGREGPPSFDVPDNILDITPFPIGQPSNKILFPSLQVKNKDSPRIPQNLDKFNQAGTITDDIIKNPNLVLKNAIQGQTITETIAFEVSTGPPAPKASMNGGGTANISFLAGTQSPITTQAPSTNDKPNAHAAFMTSKFWIETVAYQVNVPRLTTRDTILLKPKMPNNTAPTPVFAITPPARLPSPPKTITVPGVQIQYSQTVNLNFATLAWPHVSVATLVPTGPQPFKMT